MENVISLYEQLVIHNITYETTNNFVTANCEIIFQNKRVKSSFLISHTDLNRILSKILSSGYEFDTDQLETILLEDGTEIIDYQFDKAFGGPVTITGFEFSHVVTEIRA